jgi:hypothetical protein
MRVLEYSDLDLHGVEKSYQKVKSMLEKGDFYSAEVKKLQPTSYYRAKLDDTNRALFQIVHYDGKKYILMLEIIHQHRYEKSKFLQGAKVDESKIIAQSTEVSSEPMRYINPSRTRFHLLDKWISFDDHQEMIYQSPLPLVIIGSAGSGKTALTLEKMKHCKGDILYVTHSSYLVQHAQRLYYANYYTNDQQSIDFFSYREFLEAIQIPGGREMPFHDFSAWIKRLKPNKLLRDPHKILEEFRGVITGVALDKPYLSQSDYLNLGIKQSIYLAEEREFIYGIFTRYLNFCRENHYLDFNILSYDYLSQCHPKYDAVVIDEVQDFTSIQLGLIHKSLKNPEQFLMCGDANQIVHPNFFSWSKIKTLFYQGSLSTHEQALRILTVNYRNSAAVTQLANQILRIKNARLGSIDKESHNLMANHSQKPGSLFFWHTEDKNTVELNQKTQQSTRYAVIVIRDEWKEIAKRYFQTPLVFSIFETKGLEYDHIILFDFITAENAPFAEISQGVNLTDLQREFSYARAKDKTDKSLEIYKFYINALYVAITRSLQNVYWVESQKKHPLFDLLQLEQYQSALNLKTASSSLEEWQKEARKLEMQGKHEQADAIRDRLQQIPVPWTVMTLPYLQPLWQQVEEGKAGKDQKIQLLEYALIYQQNRVIELLAKQGLSAAQNTQKSAELVWRKYFDAYSSLNLSSTQTQVRKYGVDFRNLFNQTMLMVAGVVGNVVLVRWLLESGANPDLTDNASKTAFDLILQKACHDKRFAQTKLGELFQALAPDSWHVQANGRLVKIDQHHAEFLLLSVCLDFNKPFSAGELASILEYFPGPVCPDYRKRRQYISALLAKNEVLGQNPYNRYLFQRIRVGKYVLNPGLYLKRSDRWQPLTTALQGQSFLPGDVKILQQWCHQVQIRTFLLPEEARQLWPPTLKTKMHPSIADQCNDGSVEMALELTIHAHYQQQSIFSIHLVQSAQFSGAISLSEAQLLSYGAKVLLPSALVQVNKHLARSGLPHIVFSFSEHHATVEAASQY